MKVTRATSNVCVNRKPIGLTEVGQGLLRVMLKSSTRQRDETPTRRREGAACELLGNVERIVGDDRLPRASEAGY